MTNDTEMRTRRGGVALWRQIADVLREEIVRGVHRAGARLPGETSLAARFQVNRHTVRQAIQTLAEEGYVRAERGRGTIVQETRLAYPIARRTRFSEIVSAQAREPEARLLSSAMEPAPDDLAAMLRCPAGAGLVRLETLSLVDRRPLSLSSHWFVAERLGGIAQAFAVEASVTRALRACGVEDYLRRETRVTARSATPEEAALLDLRVGAPLLVSEAENAVSDGTPTHVTLARFAAERVQIVVRGDS